MNQRHEMILEKTYSTGAEEWNCPTCGRRMLISWEPKFKRTVLEAGNPDPPHGGFKGSLPMGDHRVPPMDENSLSQETEIPIEETRLAPWQAWLEEIDFENLWDSDDQ